MVSGKWLKLVKSLQIKKYRQLHQWFLVEGTKSVTELLDSHFAIEVLFGTDTFLRQHIRTRSNISFEYHPASEDELARMGSFQTNNSVLAVVQMPRPYPLRIEKGEYALALDGIQDPGNLGTIIRIADWYGIKKIFCSEDTADLYNPKVIASSMGSFIRVSTRYGELAEHFAAMQDIPKLGAFLEGENVHNYTFPDSGIIVMGNESKGIRADLHAYISGRVHIPRYGGAESLNAGIATAIICDNLRRTKN
jgi:TrmH family RNA methyltransferase